MKDHGLLVEKYRPTNIDNYVGNESIKKSISNYIGQNDIQNLHTVSQLSAFIKQISIQAQDQQHNNDSLKAVEELQLYEP